MTFHIKTRMPLSDISLRFCSCCLKKFCPRPEQVEGEHVRFFVPTIDALFREHFAYIEAPRRLIEFLYEKEEKCSLNLAEVATILHIEKGDFPDDVRVQEIVSFYGGRDSTPMREGNRLAA